MGKNIVWIDDEYYTLYPIVRPLRENNYNILGIRTVQEALDDLDSIRTADLILLDLILPSGTANINAKGRFLGFDLLRTLREYGIQTPVIVFSIVKNPEILNQIRNDPRVIAILAKDPSPEMESELKDTVIKALTGSQSKI